jgi:Lipid A 3-O-deacylase (PagL)
MRRRTGFCLAAAAFAVATAATAAESASQPLASAYYGRGANTNVYGVEWMFRQPCACEFLTRHNLEPRLAVNVAYWDGQQPDNAHPSLWDFGAHGYFRYFWHPPIAAAPFVEVGLGVHALTRDQINNNREFGTWFQFGSRIGGGFAFDASRRTELLAYIEHISNASLASPNDGITIKGIQVRVALP